MAPEKFTLLLTSICETFFYALLALLLVAAALGAGVAALEALERLK